MRAVIGEYNKCKEEGDKTMNTTANYNLFSLADFKAKLAAIMSAKPAPKKGKKNYTRKPVARPF